MKVRFSGTGKAAVVPSMAVVSVWALLMASFCIIAQLVTLTSSYWATFSGRPTNGGSEEVGHYGLWTICASKVQHAVLEDCRPESVGFQMPSQRPVAAAMAILHLAVLSVFVPLAILRIFQVAWEAQDLGLRSKLLCLLKASLAFAAVIFALITVALASTGEKVPGYEVWKGWAFWVQVAIVVQDVFLVLTCAMENMQYWQHSRDGGQSDLPDVREMEVEVVHDNRPYRAVTPPPSEGGSLAVTEVSGRPYYPNGATHHHKVKSTKVPSMISDSPPTRWRYSPPPPDRRSRGDVTQRDGRTVITIGGYGNAAYGDTSLPRVARKERRHR